MEDKELKRLKNDISDYMDYVVGEMISFLELKFPGEAKKFLQIEQILYVGKNLDLIKY